MEQCLLYSQSIPLLICTCKIIFSLAQGIMKFVISEIYLLINYNGESVTDTSLYIMEQLQHIS